MGRNLESRRAWARRYYLLHRDDVEKKEKKKKYLRGYYQNHKREHRESQRRWYKDNPDKVLAMRKKRLDKFRTDPGHHYSSLIYRFKNGTGHRKIPVIISREEFIEWYNKQPQRCFYCGITREKMLKIRDSYLQSAKKLGIDRMDDSQPYIKGNLALACHRCNSVKNNFFTAKEMKEIAKKYIVPKWSFLDERA